MIFSDITMIIAIEILKGKILVINPTVVEGYWPWQRDKAGRDC